MTALFDALDVMPSDLFFGGCVAALIALAVVDRLVTRRWSELG